MVAPRVHTDTRSSERPAIRRGFYPISLFEKDAGEVEGGNAQERRTRLRGVRSHWEKKGWRMPRNDDGDNEYEETMRSQDSDLQNLGIVPVRSSTTIPTTAVSSDQNAW